MQVGALGGLKKLIRKLIYEVYVDDTQLHDVDWLRHEWPVAAEAWDLMFQERYDALGITVPVPKPEDVSVSRGRLTAYATVPSKSGAAPKRIRLTWHPYDTDVPDAEGGAWQFDGVKLKQPEAYVQNNRTAMVKAGEEAWAKRERPGQSRTKRDEFAWLLNTKRSPM